MSISKQELEARLLNGHLDYKTIQLQNSDVQQILAALQDTPQTAPGTDMGFPTLRNIHFPAQSLYQNSIRIEPSTPGYQSYSPDTQTVQLPSTLLHNADTIKLPGNGSFSSQADTIKFPGNTANQFNQADTIKFSGNTAYSSPNADTIKLPAGTGFSSDTIKLPGGYVPNITPGHSLSNHTGKSPAPASADADTIKLSNNHHLYSVPDAAKQPTSSLYSATAGADTIKLPGAPAPAAQNTFQMPNARSHVDSFKLPPKSNNPPAGSSNLYSNFADADTVKITSNAAAFIHNAFAQADSVPQSNPSLAETIKLPKSPPRARPKQPAQPVDADASTIKLSSNSAPYVPNALAPQPYNIDNAFSNADTVKLASKNSHPHLVGSGSQPQLPVHVPSATSVLNTKSEGSTPLSVSADSVTRVPPASADPGLASPQERKSRSRRNRKEKKEEPFGDDLSSVGAVRPKKSSSHRTRNGSTPSTPNVPTAAPQSPVPVVHSPSPPTAVSPSPAPAYNLYSPIQQAPTPPVVQVPQVTGSPTVARPMSYAYTGASSQGAYAYPAGYSPVPVKVTPTPPTAVQGVDSSVVNQLKALNLQPSAHVQASPMPATHSVQPQLHAQSNSKTPAPRPASVVYQPSEHQVINAPVSTPMKLNGNNPILSQLQALNPNLPAVTTPSPPVPKADFYSVPSQPAANSVNPNTAQSRNPVTPTQPAANPVTPNLAQARPAVQPVAQPAVMPVNPGLARPVSTGFAPHTPVVQGSGPVGHSPAPGYTPPGWIECKDPSGRPFFIHQETQTTHWKLPPAGWLVMKTPYGHVFYYDPATQTTHWTLP